MLHRLEGEIQGSYRVLTGVSRRFIGDAGELQRNFNGLSEAFQRVSLVFQAVS